jgi:hypothetical protein
MPTKRRWSETTNELLEVMDVESEYREMGLRIPDGAQPKENGFLACHAIDREDQNPSAWINLNNGYYGDSASTELPVSIFDFAADHGGHANWREAKLALCKKYKISAPRSRENDRPEEKFSFSQNKFHPVLIGGMISRYPAITYEGVVLCGGKLAVYPPGTAGSRSVIAFPAFGPGACHESPCGYVLKATDGNPIAKYTGPATPPAMLKNMTVSGSRSGLVGRLGVTNLGRPECDLVIKVEGITDLLCLQSLVPKGDQRRYAIVTNLGGATETQMPREIAPLFTDKNVVVLHDADEPGQTGAKVWTGILMGVGATVRNLQLPYDVEPKHGKDLRDWIDEGGTWESLLEMIDQTPQVTTERVAEDPDAYVMSPEEELCERLGITVIGEIEGTQTILIYSHHVGKESRITNIDRWRRANAIQAVGPQIAAQVTDSMEGMDDGVIRMRTLQAAIAAVASDKPIDDAEDVLGPGNWLLKGGENEDDKVVMVGRGEIAIWNGQLIPQSTPLVNGRRVNKVTPRRWFTCKDIDRRIEKSKDRRWCQQVMTQANALFSRWDNWKHQTNPEVISALVGCTWLQNVWTWRPMVMVTGPPNSGKSTLLGWDQCLHRMFGELSVVISKASEAGVRAVLNKTSCVLLMDEFESDAHRDKIMQLYRTSSRGGKSLRSSSDQKAKLFGIAHLTWNAAIELGVLETADRNRSIFIELVGIPMDRGSQLVLPDAEELNSLGLDILAVTLRHWQRAKHLAGELIKVPHSGIDPRIVESFSAPVGLWGAIYDLETRGANEVMTGWLSDRMGSSLMIQEQDELTLLAAIYNSLVRTSSGDSISVARILASQNGDGNDDRTSSGWSETLQHHGIQGITAYAPNPSRIFFRTDVIYSRLLKHDERWRGKDISQILIRIEGAERCRQRVGGISSKFRPYGIAIPSVIIDKILGGE